MTIAKKKCSSCTHFLKLHKFALCTLQDGRTSSDGHCNLWKGKKNKRSNYRKNLNDYVGKNILSTL